MGELETVGVLGQVAGMLGWASQTDEHRDTDGSIFTPTGEELSVDLRAFGQYGSVGERATASLKRLTFDDEAPSLSLVRGDDDTLEGFAAAMRDMFPRWQQAHADDLARCAAILAPYREFAVEVAKHMGDGWTGDAGSKNHHHDDRLNPVAFVSKGELLVQWSPVNTMYGGRDGRRHDAPRLTIRGQRSDWPDRLWSENPVITVAATQTAKRVAGEITRRLLPGYIATMRKADTENIRHHQAVTGAASLAAVVTQGLQELGVREPSATRDRTSEALEVSFYKSLTAGPTVRGTVRCTRTGANLELNVGTMDERTTKLMLKAIVAAAAKFSPVVSPQ
ncbi:MAG: hypothetical protein ACYC63_04640 [Armatimonadota bacterium]